MVILEAMRQGLPVISTGEGGIPDIIEDGKTGYVSDVSNPESLAEKIGILLEKPTLRKKMGENAARRYSEMFTLEKFERNMLEALSEV